MNKKIQSIILISILALGGCATGGFSPDVVSRDAAGKSQYVQSGTIVSIKRVTIEGDRDSGNIFGSILGAIIGSNIGGDEDQTTQACDRLWSHRSEDTKHSALALLPASPLQGARACLRHARLDAQRPPHEPAHGGDARANPAGRHLRPMWI